MSRHGTFRSRVAAVVPAAVVITCGIFFILPLLTLARYALQNVPAFLLGRDTLFSKWSLEGMTLAFKDDAFWPALRLSLTLAAGTVALTLGLLVPTAVWTHLRVPRARGIIEFLTVLPYMIPPIAMVAGIIVVKPHARWFLNSDLSLIPFYVVLALPFSYRSLDAGLRAIDLRTLVDASRSLGAGWGMTLRSVLLPNLRSAIVSVSFLTAAITVGEFTIADTLLKETLPRYQATFVGREPQGGYALNLLALLATTLLFVVLNRITRPRDRSRTAYVPPAADVAPITNEGAS